MKFVSYFENGTQKVGIWKESGIVPVVNKLEDIVTMNFDQLEELQSSAQGLVVDETGLELAPCVPAYRKIICIGLNYRKHAEEAKMAIPEYPILFNKYNNALSAHGSAVVLPATAEEFDYEAELGIVIGKRAKAVSKEAALDFVFGYCNVNDLSARDLQFRTGQWMLGKSLDSFCPVGPYLVSADEVGNPNELTIQCYVNGELRQNSNTRDMIFPVDEIVSYVSTYITLEPGDLIITGTPEGVIAGYPQDQKQWLKPGDIVSVKIERLGTLTNRLIGIQ